MKIEFDYSSNLPHSHSDTAFKYTYFARNSGNGGLPERPQYILFEQKLHDFLLERFCSIKLQCDVNYGSRTFEFDDPLEEASFQLYLGKEIEI